MRVVRQGARTPEHVIAAIVDDYRAGLPTAIIAARHGVTTKTVNRHPTLTTTSRALADKFAQPQEATPMSIYYEEPARLEEHKRGTRYAYQIPPAAELAARIRGGESVDAVAASIELSRDALLRRLFKSGWNAAGQVITEEPLITCGWCGRATRSTDRACRACQGIESYARLVPGHTDALTGGRWVTVRGIQRWAGPRPVDAPPPERQVAQCGTDGGYHRHIRRTKTPPCEPCKAAHRETNRRYPRVAA